MINTTIDRGASERQPDMKTGRDASAQRTGRDPHAPVPAIPSSAHSLANISLHDTSARSARTALRPAIPIPGAPLQAMRVLRDGIVVDIPDEQVLPSDVPVPDGAGGPAGAPASGGASSGASPAAASDNAPAPASSSAMSSSAMSESAISSSAAPAASTASALASMPAPSQAPPLEAAEMPESAPVNEAPAPAPSSSISAPGPVAGGSLPSLSAAAPAPAPAPAPAAAPASIPAQRLDDIVSDHPFDQPAPDPSPLALPGATLPITSSMGASSPQAAVSAPRPATPQASSSAMPVSRPMAAAAASSSAYASERTGLFARSRPSNYGSASAAPMGNLVGDDGDDGDAAAIPPAAAGVPAAGVPATVMPAAAGGAPAAAGGAPAAAGGVPAAAGGAAAYVPPPYAPPSNAEAAYNNLNANTPGPLTGFAGTAGTITNMATTLRSPTPSGDPAFSDRLASTAPVANSIASATASGVTGIADAAAIARDTYNLTQLPGRAFGRQAPTNAREAEERSAARRLPVNVGTNLADLGAVQVPSMWSAGAAAAGSSAPAVLGTVAAAGGVGVSSLVMARSGIRAGRAAMHQSNVGALLTGPNQLPPGRVRAAAEHHTGQMRARKWRNGIGALGAAASVAGGAILLGGLAATPIGWGLLAAGGLVAAGLGAYKLGRWLKKKFWPSAGDRLGEQRNIHAHALHDAATNPAAPDRADARRLLDARGIPHAHVRGNEGVDLLKRKAESW